MEKPSTQTHVPISLEKDPGKRYEQLERLVTDNVNIPHWDSFEATRKKTQEVCAYILSELQKDEAVLEPIHLSMLQRQITICKKFTPSDYRALQPKSRLALLERALKRGQ